MLATISDDLKRPRDKNSGSSSTDLCQNLVKLYAKHGEAYQKLVYFSTT